MPSHAMPHRAPNVPLRVLEGLKCCVGWSSQLMFIEGFVAVFFQNGLLFFQRSTGA